MMRGVLKRRAQRGERGAAAVEFALILPLLMVLVFGIINYGDMLSVRQSVSQAASEGARAAAVDPGDDVAKVAAARSAIKDALKAQGQECESDDDCPINIGACAGEADKQCVSVKVKIDYDAIIPGFGLILPNGLSYTAVARVS